VHSAEPRVPYPKSLAVGIEYGSTNSLRPVADDPRRTLNLTGVG